MIKNNLKIAFRNILYNKTITAINVIGLSIGLATSILLMIWVRDELSFDQFHRNYNSIYRLIGFENTLSSPQPLAPVIKKEIPEIVNSTRLLFWSGELEYNKTIYKYNPVLTDITFFEMFSFPFIKGDPKIAMSGSGSMVISEHLAKKIFGDKDAMGQTISILLPGRKMDYTITGVYKDFPSNSHIQADYIVSFPDFVKRHHGGSMQYWSDWASFTYIQTCKNCDITQLKQKITDCVLNHTNNNSDYIVKQLQPMKDIHLHSSFPGEYAVCTDMKYIYIFSIIVFIILLIACINYINLTISSAIKRIKEIGIKKAVGATRMSIIKQFAVESFLVVTIVLNIAFLLIILFIPSFNAITEKTLEFNFLNISIIFFITGVVLFIGLFAGFFPALYLSSFKPKEIMQLKTCHPKNKVLAGSLLSTVQFVLSVAVIIGALIINKQIEYMKNMNHGFDKNNLVYFSLMNNSPENIQRIKNKLSDNPDILNVTSGHLIAQTSNGTNSINWEGKTLKDNNIFVKVHRVDYDFLNAYKIQIKEGRFFSEEFSTDKTSAFVLNEAAVAAFNLESPVGEYFSLWDISGTVIGVIKNYHYQTAHHQISPTVLLMNTDKNFGGFGSITLRINPENMDKTIKYAQNIIHQHNNGYKPEYHFLDSSFDNRYQFEKRLSIIFNIASMLAILISCIGLFALISLTVKKQTKEIGIRKVNGASVLSILGILSKNIIIWVSIAVLTASPMAWYFSNKWLQNFAYRTSISWWIFVIAGLISLVFALLTVSWQSWQAAMRNPVEALRYE